MKIYDFFHAPKEHQSMTIGMFDGVHQGHQNLIQQLIQWSHNNQQKSTIITFSRHPLEILTGNPPLLILPLEKKLEFFEKLGVDICLILDFTAEVAQIPAIVFLQDLVHRLGMKAIVAGKDFRFGKEGQGDFAMLEKYSIPYQYQTHILSIQQDEQDKISSTNIRKAIREGNITKANRMLGRPFSLIGNVIPGQQLGRVLGFPTANLKLLHDLYPAYGVYAGYTLLGEQKFPSLISIGDCPTFGTENFKIEVYLLEYQGSLYGQTLETQIYARIRDQKKFNSAQELCQQLERDREHLSRLLY